MSTLPKAQSADIMMLLEGTYPYVSGGVSSWVHRLIEGFPEYRFACVFLGSRPEDYGDLRYPLPENVVHVETHYLHDTHEAPAPRILKGDAEAMKQVRRFHDRLRAVSAGDTPPDGLAETLREALSPDGMDEAQFLHSQAAWDFITENYRAHCTDPSFVDYFWSVRSMHRPIWQLRRIAENLIPATLYHTVSTGYAGFLGTLLKQQTGRPLLLSEHGIYTKERKIDLLKSDWLVDNRDLFQMEPTQISYFRELWIRFFASLGRMCYGASDQIVSLFEANRQRQLEDGAQNERTCTIPNGIRVAAFQAARASRPATPPNVLCLIGRVVPVKDIKTFIRAMRVVVNHIPDAEGWIAGPRGEDPAYVQECEALAVSLGLTENIRFLGLQKMDDLLPRIGLTVLSSISEGLPLVLLESMAAGVPAVVTDVGACRQLIEGRGEEDQSIGKSGAVVRIADPEALANAALALLEDNDRWHAASLAGLRRVERTYQESQMLEAYRTLYRQLLASDVQTSSSKARCPHARQN